MKTVALLGAGVFAGLAAAYASLVWYFRGMFR